jgi:hypothetical protein
MALVDQLASIAVQPYDRRSILGVEQPIFSTLASICDWLRSYFPRGYTVRYSRGVGGLPDGLWVAILNNAVTSSPTEGMYLVFLFDRDRTTVSLSLNQGVAQATQVARALPLTRNQLLRAEAEGLRELLPPQVVERFTSEIQLGAGSRLSGYENGNIIAATWALAALPSETEVENALDELLDAYELLVTAKETDLIATPGLFRMPARSSRRVAPYMPLFAPKDSASYTVDAKTYLEPMVRRREHERLVKEFGEWAMARGFTPATNVHPIDLTLQRAGREILVEAKMLDVKHPAGGVRESIGQLFEYRRFLRPDNPEAPLLGLYSSYPGGAFVELLSDLGIAGAWRDDVSFGVSVLSTGLGL